MVRVWIVAACVTSLVAAAAGQVLDLGGGGTPPPLERPTWPQVVGEMLEDEIAQRLVGEPLAPEWEQPVLRASANVRVIAAELLAAGDAAGAGGSEAILAGATLAAGRDAIDGALDRLGRLGARLREAGGAAEPGLRERHDAIVAALRRFNADASRLGDTARTADRERLDDALPALLASLADAVARLEGTVMQPTWPGAPAVDRRDAAGVRGSVRSAASIARIRDRAASAALDEPSRDTIAEILDWAERAERFPEYRARAAQCRELAADALDVADAIGRATWLAPTAVEEGRERLRRALSLFAEPASRARGRREVDALQSWTTLLQRVSRLESVDAAVSRHLAPILQAPQAVDGPVPLRVIVDRMIEYRELDASSVTGPLRVTHRRLERAYRDAEKGLLERLAEIVEATDPLADPRWSSVIGGHRQRLDDLQFVSRTPGWIEAITLIDAEAGAAFAARIRRRCAALLEPAQRDGAALEMQRFQDELDRFYPLPYESSLRRAEAAAVQATGGQHDAYVATIDERRAEWARAWAAGDPGTEAADRLDRLHRLNRAMSDLATIFDRSGAVEVLNRWPAWELGPEPLAVAIAALPGRLKLATVSAVEGDDAALDRQLDEIDREAPLAALAGRLAARLERRLSPRPGGATAVLAQLVHAPPRDAWLLHRRRDLADICRYSLEQSHAVASNRATLAREIDEYVTERARDILREMDGEP